MQALMMTMYTSEYNANPMDDKIFGDAHTDSNKVL